MGRRLGQHFLFQRTILDRIAEAACGDRCTLCIEIGPGPGGLTAALLPRAERLVAVEIDPSLAAALREKYGAEPRFTLVEQDVLQADLSAWHAEVICGNLPYYITSPIVEKVLSLDAPPANAVFLVQKEVGERMAATPGTRDYGYFSVAVQARAEVERLFPVKPSAFKPPPKVDSTVVRLKPRMHPAVADMAGFLRFAGLCFHQKRKTLRNNLRGLAHSGRLDPAVLSMRAEQLTIGQLASLYAELCRMSSES